MSLKIHIHSDQFDEHYHSWCGRGKLVAMPDKFEATPREQRCKLCEDDWFPFGQPDWHLKQSQDREAKRLSK